MCAPRREEEKSDSRQRDKYRCADTRTGSAWAYPKPLRRGIDRLTDAVVADDEGLADGLHHNVHADQYVDGVVVQRQAAQVDARGAATHDLGADEHGSPVEEDEGQDDAQIGQRKVPRELQLQRLGPVLRGGRIRHAGDCIEKDWGRT